MFRLMRDIYENSDAECKIAISFNLGTDGKKFNNCREMVLRYIQNPSLDTGRNLAEKLSSVTTQRSKLGLLFLILGSEKEFKKIILSRFPTNSAILAEEDKITLNVAFLERVFLRSATSYKAVVYQHTSLSSGFWEGNAVDKQITNSETGTSNYWIKDFLESDFRTTGPAGTRRLAVALRQAAKKSSNLQVKKEIAAAVTLANSLNGQNLTPREFVNRFAFSQPSKDAIIREVKSPHTMDERFVFDAQEFSNQVPYRSIELDSGAILTAQASEFDNIFSREPVSPERDQFRYSTTGIVISEKLEKTK